MPDSLPTDAHPEAPLARGEAVELAYGSSVAVAASDFTIPLPGVTAIIGPNGSGKSTLLNALAGVVEARSGSLEVLGGSPTDAYRRVSYVMQSLAFPEGTPITVREVVAMGRLPHAPDPQADELAAIMVAFEDVGYTDLVLLSVKTPPQRHARDAA